MRAGPGAKVLRRHFFAGDLAQILVHIGGVDGAAFAILVDILEQLVPRQIATVLDDPGQAAIVDVGLVLYAALAPKGYVNAAAVDRDVAVPQRRQSVALVLLGVF